VNKDTESKFQEDIKSVCENHHVKGHLLVYLDGEVFKFTGTLSATALAPLLVKAMADKFLK
jgi:hypothetical protein